MKRLTREQKKIIFISGIALAVFLLFWVFIYLPRKQEIVFMKKELAFAEEKIAQITILTEGKDLAQTVGNLKVNFNKLESQIPRQDESVIRNLSQEAMDLKIKIEKIISSSQKTEKQQVAGYFVEELAIKLNLVCEFSALGEYLNILRNKFPVLVKARSLTITGRGEGVRELEVVLEILAYLSK